MIDDLDYAQRLINLEREINKLHAQIRELESTLIREREIHLKIAEHADNPINNSTTNERYRRTP